MKTLSSANRIGAGLWILIHFCAPKLAPAQQVPLSIALDAPELTFTTGGDGGWFGSSNYSVDNFSAASVSGPSRDESWIETSVVGPGSLTFSWSMNSFFGNLYFEIDGQITSYANALGGWREFNEAIPSGNHTLRWAYAIEVLGSPSAWLDEVRFAPAGTPPKFTVPMQPKTVSTNTGVVIRAFAKGSAPVSYQWFHDGVSLPGETNAAIVLTHIKVADAGAYSVIATNSFGVASNAVGLTVSTASIGDALDAPNLFWSSTNEWAGSYDALMLVTTNVAAVGGTSVQFGWEGDSPGVNGAIGGTLQTDFAGPGTLRFWWKAETIGGGTDGGRLQFDSNTYISGNSDWRQEAVYLPSGSNHLAWAYFDSFYGLTLTRAWLDGVEIVPGGTAPVVTVDPLSATNVPHGSVSFSASAMGTPPLAYKWQFDGRDIPMATSENLTLADLSSNSAGQYAMVITNLFGSITSRVATLSVLAAPVPPVLEFTGYPPFGNSGFLTGRATDVDARFYGVAVYIYVNGWWTKPSWQYPLTAIHADGSWACNVVTGGDDAHATRYAAFLVPLSYLPPSVAGDGALPSQLENFSVDRFIVDRFPRLIRFATLDWSVKAGFWGPGPNQFSYTTNNVWVDEYGALHLKVTHDGSGWSCAEVISRGSFGFGQYRFYLESDASTLDPNVVLGLFTWSDVADFNHREIDIECSRWGVVTNLNAQFVVQPFSLADNLFRFELPRGSTGSTHVFTWAPDRISFESYLGWVAATNAGATPNSSWTFSIPDRIPPPGGENVRINLWLYNSQPPSDGQNAEVVVKHFEFLPLIKFLSVSITNGVPTLLIQSDIGRSLDLQVSTDLSNWTRLASLTNQSGTVLYIDNSSERPEKRFYRAIGR
jgi:hypothetical protein